MKYVAALVLLASLNANASSLSCDVNSTTGVPLGNHIIGASVDPHNGGFMGIYGDGDLGFELWERDVNAVVESGHFDRKTQCEETTVNPGQSIIQFVFNCRKVSAGKASEFESKLIFNKANLTGSYSGELTDSTGVRKFEFAFSNCY